MRIRWEVDDGYCGKGRPQITEVSDAELEECVSEREREDLIADYIQEDFDNKISWYIVSRDDEEEI